MKKIKKNWTGLSNDELNSFSGGGNEGNLLGLGIASAIAFGYMGPLGMAICYWNYFKD
jgi:hypothetical protein